MLCSILQSVFGAENVQKIRSQLRCCAMQWSVLRKSALDLNSKKEDDPILLATRSEGNHAHSNVLLYIASPSFLIYHNGSIQYLNSIVTK